MTPDQARAVIQEKLGVAATGEGPALAVTVPAGQWLTAARLADALREGRDAYVLSVVRSSS